MDKDLGFYDLPSEDVDGIVTSFYAEPLTKSSRKRKRGHGGDTRPSKKLRHSIFQLVVNTNISMDENDPDFEDLQEELLDAFEDCMKGRAMGKFVNFVNDDEAQWNKDYIKKAEAEGKVEIGEEFGRVHLQAVIHIAHYTKLQVAKDRLREFFNKRLGIKSAFVGVHWVPYKSTSDIVLEKIFDYNFKGRWVNPNSKTRPALLDST